MGAGKKRERLERFACPYPYSLVYLSNVELSSILVLFKCKSRLFDETSLETVGRVGEMYSELL